MKLPPLTTKQTEILLLLYRYRFLNRIHIQKFLNHKNDTRISQWLKSLTDQGVITRIYSQTREHMNTPAVYYLGLKSRYYLQENKDCSPDLLKRVYQEKKRTEIFRSHWLCIADLYFHFLIAASREQSTLQFLTTTDLVSFAYTPLPLPDAYIAITDPKSHSKRYFLELIDEKSPRFVLRNLISRYFKYYERKYWQDHYIYPFPKLLIICPNVFTKNYLMGFISETLEEKEIPVEFFLALRLDIQKGGIQSDTWEAAG